jgi:hypothetical protein
MGVDGAGNGDGYSGDSHTWLGSPAITEENVDEFLQNRMTIAATEMDRKWPAIFTRIEYTRILPYHVYNSAETRRIGSL